MINGTGSKEEMVSGGILRYFVEREAKIYGRASSQDWSLAFFFSVPDFACYLEFSFFSLGLDSEGCTDVE